MDVNDNVPEWSMVPTPYLAVVTPDAPAGTVVYKLHALDGDEGNNGEVEYYLSDGGYSLNYTIVVLKLSEKNRVSVPTLPVYCYYYKKKNYWYLSVYVYGIF